MVRRTMANAPIYGSPKTRPGQNGSQCPALDGPGRALCESWAAPCRRPSARLCASGRLDSVLRALRRPAWPQQQQRCSSALKTRSARERLCWVLIQTRSPACCYSPRRRLDSFARSQKVHGGRARAPRTTTRGSRRSTPRPLTNRRPERNFNLLNLGFRWLDVV